MLSEISALHRVRYIKRPKRRIGMVKSAQVIQLNTAKTNLPPLGALSVLENTSAKTRSRFGSGTLSDSYGVVRDPAADEYEHLKRMKY